jgi:ribosomal-protein-alanine N-acetyltransferase
VNTKINRKHFEKFPVFESERLLYRKLLKSNAKDLFAIRSDDETMKYMDTLEMKTIKEAKAFIASVKDAYKEKQGITWAIIEKSANIFIGHFGFWKLKPEHCRAEIGYALNRKFWGKGFMSETLNAMVNFGFNELKLHSIEANVNPNNKRSIKLLEKAGFKKEAYFKEDYLFNGTYLDSEIYSLLETDICSHIH